MCDGRPRIQPARCGGTTKAGVLGAHGHDAGGGEQNLGARLVVHGSTIQRGIVVQPITAVKRWQSVLCFIIFLRENAGPSGRASDSDARSAACIPMARIVDVFEGVMGEFLVYCMDVQLSASATRVCACG